MRNSCYQGESTYLLNDHYKYEKENFRKLKFLIGNQIKNKTLQKFKFLDIGCASGVLIKYLSEKFSKCQFEGIDISSKLLDIAKKNNPHANFYEASILNFKTARKYDFILCIGVIGIFDPQEAQVLLKKIICMLENGGTAYIFHQFNDFDIDVLIRHRRSDRDNFWKTWGCGWNIYSKITIQKWLKNKVTSFRFIDFKMPYKIKKSENPVRTWTIKTASNKFQLTNGLNLLVNLKFLVIKK